MFKYWTVLSCRSYAKGNADKFGFKFVHCIYLLLVRHSLQEMREQNWKTETNLEMWTSMETMLSKSEENDMQEGNVNNVRINKWNKLNIFYVPKIFKIYLLLILILILNLALSMYPCKEKGSVLFPNLYLVFTGKSFVPMFVSVCVCELSEENVGVTFYAWYFNFFDFYPSVTFCHLSSLWISVPISSPPVVANWIELAPSRLKMYIIDIITSHRLSDRWLL